MSALLELRGITVAYPRGLHERTVLDGVSLDVNAGDFIAIYGQRGAGKTTLLRIAAGLQIPDSGTVTFDGSELSRLSARQLADVHGEGIGWVMRGSPSPELSVEDHVALPLLARCGRREAHRRASAALSSVGAKDCALAYGPDLSDSEQVHVALAHALVREPRVLVLDDPTACLDVVERESIVARLRGLADASRVAVLMAVPDLGACLAAHDVLSLSGGRLLSAPSQGSVIAFPRSGRSA